MTNRSDSPVWGVYDLYRTARLNVRYYSVRLHKFEMLNLGMDIIIAATAPSSAIAGLWFWNTPIGSTAWKVLGIIAAIAAVTKPVLMLPKRVKSYNEVLAGYRTLEHDLYEIKEMINQKQGYDKELQLDFRKALKRKGILVAKDPESKQDKVLIKKLVAEINQELPVGSFYIPSI